MKPMTLVIGANTHTQARSQICGVFPVCITDNVPLTKQKIYKSPRLPDVARSSVLVLLSILPNSTTGSSLEASDVYRQRSPSEGKWSPRQWERIIAFPQHVKSTDAFLTFLGFYSEGKTFTKVETDNFCLSNYICQWCYKCEKKKKKVKNVL